jgi:hypothetical protein
MGMSPWRLRWLPGLSFVDEAMKRSRAKRGFAPSNFEMPRALREACMTKAKNEGKSFACWASEVLHKAVFPDLPFFAPDPEPECFRDSLKNVYIDQPVVVEPTIEPVERPTDPEKRCERCKRLGRRHCPLCEKEVEL